MPTSKQIKEAFERNEQVLLKQPALGKKMGKVTGLMFRDIIEPLK